MVLFDKFLTEFRGSYAHKSVLNQGDGIYVLQGKFGRIFPHSLDGSVFGVAATSQDSPMSTRKANIIAEKLKPFCSMVNALDGGELEATFPRENLAQVAEILRVRKRGKAPEVGVQERLVAEEN